MIRRTGYMAAFHVDPDDPLAPARGQSLDGLLALLEQLDGVEEAEVVRSALAAGVPRERVLDEPAGHGVVRSVAPLPHRSGQRAGLEPAGMSQPPSVAVVQATPATSPAPQIRRPPSRARSTSTMCRPADIAYAPCGDHA
jgi:hypothetical protein